MNISSSRIIQYLGIFLLSLFIGYLVFSFADRDRGREIDQASETEQAAVIKQAAIIEEAVDIDIVGEWQSEPILGQLGLMQSSYTFNTDGSYSNKVDNLRLCKDVPEQNCEYYWIVLDGKYAVKNGVITLYTKEVRAEILRKGESKPDIRIAPDRPHSGDEYMAKLDAGKLFMTNTKSNELVIFKSINND